MQTMTYRKLATIYLSMILIALIALTAPAQANEPPDVAGRFTNKVGGKIILMLTDRRPACKGEDGGLDVFSYSEEGRTLEGCWWDIDKDVIKIEWENGETRAYPADEIEFTDEFIEWVRKNAQDRANSNRLNL